MQIISILKLTQQKINNSNNKNKRREEKRKENESHKSDLKEKPQNTLTEWKAKPMLISSLISGCEYDKWETIHVDIHSPVVMKQILFCECVSERWM